MEEVPHTQPGGTPALTTTEPLNRTAQQVTDWFQEAETDALQF